jgi:hypothetical protein
MRNKRIAGILLGPTLVLLIPLIAMQFTEEVNWDETDFLAAWLLMVGAAAAYSFATSRTGDVAYRAAVGLAVMTAFILIWINLAVGLIGSEDNPANLLYVGVLAVGLFGAIFAKLQPRGMFRVLLATALAQTLVPVVAFIIWQPAFTFGVVKVFILNACFAFLFVGAALLFRHAAQRHIGSKESSAA